MIKPYAFVIAGIFVGALAGAYGGYQAGQNDGDAEAKAALARCSADLSICENQVKACPAEALPWVPSLPPLHPVITAW